MVTGCIDAEIYKSINPPLIPLPGGDFQNSPLERG